jgi:hypothetical protein
MALPPSIPPRGLSLAQAAEYCGVSDATLRRHGPAPSKIGQRDVWDRQVLDRWLDGLASLPIGADANPIPDPEELLLKAIHARNTALRHPTAKPQRKGAVVLAETGTPSDSAPRRCGRARRHGGTPQ